MRHRTIPPGRRAGAGPSVLTHDAEPRSSTRAAALHFEIGRITLYGYSASENARFTHSLRLNLTELARRHRTQAWSEANGLAIDRLDAGQLPAGASPEDAARQIGARIFAGLTQPPIPGQSGGKGYA
jgi:hypothetical protein